ncbi:ribonuclease H-like domain-containing protein [Paenibacillus sp. R14(2021)]|uniref:ribonuclease H-like domain-containing protein n=1 Tax=Paenibacillus sp. R14(2021) TaxID=2859228 RepID=UPI0021575627|nr:ribonuclease H-like domain-containing protein [Paenibacillus sp. R14(2021)]
MSGLRDRLLRMRAQQTAQAERLAGMVEQPEEIKDDGASAANASDAADELPAAASASGLPPEWDALGVRLVESAEGMFLVRESRYPFSHRHGIHQLAELPGTQPSLAAFDKQTSAFREVSNVLFLDLETTGLGVGAGNVPFMVGLAYVEDEVFVVEQMLIRHPAEERAMIAYLCGMLPSFTHLVTYNGRTFDWPVLYNRFILNGYRNFNWEPVHIDLLHPSRSVWRNTLVSCKLSHVEEERLGITRSEDVPGSLAPAIYFQYLSDGDPGPLLGVFRHNEIDMLSLAALAIRFGHFLGGGVGSAIPLPAEAEELLRTGLWLEKMGKGDLAEPLYALFAEHPRPTVKCLCLLAERDKKCGNWHRAVLLWQKAVQAAEEAAWPEYEAHIELAMYYEHRTKAFDQALALAEQAFEIAARRHAGVRLEAKRRAILEGIRKRINRLQMKRSKE